MTENFNAQFVSVFGWEDS